jgi:hypothetical protein
LNEQVKRNIKRFPVDFMFQLTSEEKEEVVAICDHLSTLKYSSQLPYVFTEYPFLHISENSLFLLSRPIGALLGSSDRMKENSV